MRTSFFGLWDDLVLGVPDRDDDHWAGESVRDGGCGVVALSPMVLRGFLMGEQKWGDIEVRG